MPLNDVEIRELLSDLESDRVERKASLSDPDKVREAICAYANDLPNHGLPGLVAVGLRDDGAPAGLDVTDDLLLRLSRMRDDGAIVPIPSMTVQRLQIDGGRDIAAVVVEPQAAPPVRFRGRTWVRVGPRRALATPEEERRLAERRRARDLPFDLSPIWDASIDDLDLVFFERDYLRAAIAPEVLEANQRPLLLQMTSLRFLAPEGVPTAMGVLIAGKDPRWFFPGAYIQFLRIAGPTVADPIVNQKVIAGTIPAQARVMDEVLFANVTTSAEFAGRPTELRQSDYSLAALQQFVRNALMHRAYDLGNAPIRVYWYSDRIEISSPGGVFGRVTPANLGDGVTVDYRNPHIAEAMQVVGLVQRFGFGIPLARRELERNGNPPPEFAADGGGVRVVVRPRIP